MTKNLKDKNPQLRGYSISIFIQSKGKTPLHFAAQFGQLEVVKAITKVLLDKNPSDYHDVTPFHDAAQEGHLPVVKYLAQFVNDLDMKAGERYDKKTPLMFASQYGHLDVVQYLIEEGANPKLKSSENKTAYDTALKSDGTTVTGYNSQNEYGYKYQVDNSEVLKYLEQFN